MTGYAGSSVYYAKSETSSRSLTNYCTYTTYSSLVTSQPTGISLTVGTTMYTERVKLGSLFFSFDNISYISGSVGTDTGGIVLFIGSVIVLSLKY